MKEGLRAESSDWKPIGPGSPFCYIPSDPFLDPFGEGFNQDLRHLLFPGDPEDETDVAQLWEEAGKAIEERDDVVFIGYSLPPYDSTALEFFKQKTAGKNIEVYSRSLEILENYRKVFGNITTDKPCSFEESTYARAFLPK